MAKLNSRLFNCLAVATIILSLSFDLALATPMVYKKNTEDKYEADLVPISSTVIPLTVLEVSYGLGGKPSEEYKKAYLKKLRKKVQHAADASEEENPDTLITVKNKSHHRDASSGSTAKVKGIESN